MIKLLEKDSIIRNRYRVLRVLGQGGMGAVYLVRDHKEKGATWAAKEFWHSHEEKLFSKEASLLMELSHWGLPRVVDYFTEYEKNYLIMERIEGLTFEDIVTKNGTFIPREIYPWALQLCEVLHYLHTRNPPVIFRDLKPSNIMLNIDGKVRLIDFGIARFYEPQKLKDTTPLGTPGYSPPEQYGRGQTTPSSDIYSLGATMYFLLTGKDPAEFSFAFPRLREINKQICPDFDQIVMTCLELKPKNRYESALEVEGALKNWRESRITWFDEFKKWLLDMLESKKMPQTVRQIGTKITRPLKRER
ncbi:MAG TPA: serine/threonine-protein kinase [Candidatus Eremiobacteraeota bacterium]|nr:MAG: Serine/threonine-protein kinase PknB [bacterium ADurb.Bin363]HPZ10609.1 serine/threonine-protein kinase [Candidatus Eremiobacteraeota bacterium]